MKRSEAVQEIKRRFDDLLIRAPRMVSGRPSYICPLCGNGSGATGDGMTIDPRGDGTRLKCFKCGFYGDDLDLYMAEHNVGMARAFEDLCFKLDIDFQEPKKDDFSLQANTTKNTTRETPEDNTRPAAETPEDYFFLTGLGTNISDETIKRAEKGIKEIARLAATDINVPNNSNERAEKEKNHLMFFSDKRCIKTYIEACKENIEDPEAKAYLIARKLSKDTVERFGLGFDNIQKMIVIPVTGEYYVARSINPEAKIRFKNPVGVKVELFNKKALYENPGEPVFIVEGAFDALSIEEAEGHAVALNSCSNARLLLGALDERKTESPLILSLDKDDGGQRAEEELARELEKRGVPYIRGHFEMFETKDANDALRKDPAEFYKDVHLLSLKAKRPDATDVYIYEQMDEDTEKAKAALTRTTHFKELDKKLGGIYPGLFVLGGVSSVGKTTFALQMADQMAEHGQHVIIFSMEQSRLELVSKSLRRYYAISRPPIEKKTELSEKDLREAKGDYIKQTEGRVSIIEGNFELSVSDIAEYVRRYARNNATLPTVMIDYLQVLRPAKGGAKDPRTAIDETVSELKRLTREGFPVIAISSLNRSNYLNPIDFESFKESGGIEYTADAVLGLQLEAVNAPLFEREGHIKEKRDMIAKAKDSTPRDVELVCIKNRLGRSRFKVSFSYYPEYDLFVEKGGGK